MKNALTKLLINLTVIAQVSKSIFLQVFIYSCIKISCSHATSSSFLIWKYELITTVIDSTESIIDSGHFYSCNSSKLNRSSNFLYVPRFWYRFFDVLFSTSWKGIFSNTAQNQWRSNTSLASITGIYYQDRNSLTQLNWGKLIAAVEWLYLFAHCLP